MRLPQIGDIVLYNDGSKQSPAMVVAVTENENGIGASSVNLKIFTDTPNGLPQYMRNVPQGDLVGSWQWRDIPVAREEEEEIHDETNTD